MEKAAGPVSYAAIAAIPPVISNGSDDIMTMLKKVTTPPEALRLLIESLRSEMEIPQATTGFRGSAVAGNVPSRGGAAVGGGTALPVRSFEASVKPGNAWRSKFSGKAGDSQWSSKPSTEVHSQQRPPPIHRPSGRYQSKFTSGNEGNLDGKILNSIIGNKLNAFTAVNYNDTRDFIYQIMDSGETSFIRDFVEKVFAKATTEELFCGLFAKLLAEIAKKYTIMYDEMKVYHTKFMEIFDDINEDVNDTSPDKIKNKQYRMGYGHFLSELAGQNALEKSQLISMINKVIVAIWELNTAEGKTKTVEELIDCIGHLIKNLKAKSNHFFMSVKADIIGCLHEKMTAMIDKKSGIARPSLSSKARFGLMDLRDLIVNE
jgi:hypothetical protein